MIFQPNLRLLRWPWQDSREIRDLIDWEDKNTPHRRRLLNVPTLLMSNCSEAVQSVKFLLISIVSISTADQKHRDKPLM